MMSPSELIGEGINLMFSGMGFVLVFFAHFNLGDWNDV